MPLRAPNKIHCSTLGSAPPEVSRTKSVRGEFQTAWAAKPAAMQSAAPAMRLESATRCWVTR